MDCRPGKEKRGNEVNPTDQIDGDRIYAEWLASGEPDWYEEWKTRRNGLRAAAEHEWDELH